MTSTRLGDVVTVKSGFAFKSADWLDSGVPVIKIANVKDGWVTLDGCSFVSEEVARSARAFELTKGDVLISMTGNIGQVAKVRDEGRMLLNQRVGRFSIKSRERIDGEYLFQWLRLPQVRAAFEAHAYGAAQPNISPSLIEQQTIPLPPLPTQRRIASILSAYDDLIENNTRRIAILEEMARSIYEEWFVRFRFPGCEGVRMVKSELGLVPEGWSVTSLGQLAEVNARSARRGAEPTEIRYVDISSVSSGSIDKKERMLFADAPGRARRIVRDGDVIWACVRPNRKSYALVVDPEPNLLVSTGFAVLSPVAIPSSFIYQCVTTDDFVSYLVNHAKGAAYPAVGAEDFENAKVLKPANYLVKAFDRTAGPMMRLVAVLQVKNANLRTARDLLLPKLISGELDVSAVPGPEAVDA